MISRKDKNPEEKSGHNPNSKERSNNSPKDKHLDPQFHAPKKLTDPVKPDPPKA